MVSFHHDLCGQLVYVDKCGELSIYWASTPSWRKGASVNLEAVQLCECSSVSERIFLGWPNFLTLHVTS